jgi:hypothetical protein
LFLAGAKRRRGEKEKRRKGEEEKGRRGDRENGSLQKLARSKGIHYQAIL